MKWILKNSRGFTLIEVMIALSILALSLVVFYNLQGGALLASGRAESIQMASLLAREKITETLLVIQKDLEKDSLPKDEEVEEGEFEPPFDKYRWKVQIRKVEIPLSGEIAEENIDAQGDSQDDSKGDSQDDAQGTGSSAEMAPKSAQKSFAQMISKKISESLREVKVQVFWDELGEDQSVTVTTHISKL